MTLDNFAATRPGTILLVEDDSNDVETMRIALRRVGSPYHFATVPNGQEAIDYLSGTGRYANRRQFPVPCLVLLDLSLPIVNGFDVLSWMRDEWCEMPPVIVLSYSRQEHDRRRALQLGARGYYVKSPDLAGTVALVKSLLVLNFLPALSLEEA